MLCNYNLNCFQFRFLKKLVNFSYDIVNNDTIPLDLRNKIIFNYQLDKQHDLRNNKHIALPSISNFNSYGNSTFSYFFCKFINNVCIKKLNLDQSSFTQFINNDLDKIYSVFITNFDKFNLNYVNSKF